MKKASLLLLVLFVMVSLWAQDEKGNVRKIDNFLSAYIQSRDIYIWLPADYNEATKYAVIYMHDGQMLFDSLSTWNKQEWMVDETMDRLTAERKIRPTIVVGVANIPTLRYAEYFPQKVYDNIPDATRQLILQEQFKTEPKADDYLKFLTRELKPYIDSVYSTRKDAANTFVMGSSMGGLISLYALCEYPDVFGGAGCLSMHTPMVSYALFDKVDIEKDVASTFRMYLKEHLPKVNTRKIYIDYGDQTLDSYYRPYQEKIDSLMQSLGWSYPQWETLFFSGEDHSEKSWSKRLDTPLLFLLK